MARPPRTGSGTAGRAPVGDGPVGTPRLGGPQVFAAVMMVVLGAFHVLAGIAALARDDIPSVPSLSYTLPPAAWGWTQIGFGALVALAGADLGRGGRAGRLAGIGLAALSLFVNIMFVLLHPFWAVVIMAVDVVVIWALTVRWPEADGEHLPPLRHGWGADGRSI